MNPQTITAVFAAIAAAAALACCILLWRCLQAAREQVAISQRHMRESLRPVLLCTFIEPLDSNRRIATIVNQGRGVAVDIKWSDDGREPGEDHRVNGPSLVLGPGAAMDIPIDAPRTTRLIFIYASVFQELARTEVLLIADLWSNRYYAENDTAQAKSFLEHSGKQLS